MNEVVDYRTSKSVRNFGMILYPDSESYDCEYVLSYIKYFFSEWAYILHDKDVDETGELKKPHYHILIKKQSPSTISVVSNNLRVPTNYIQQVSNWRSALLYLTHCGYVEKYQYPVEDVVTNLPKKLFSSPEATAFIAYTAISHYIQDGRCRSLTDLNNWCIANGYWSEFRRSWSLFSSLLHETKSSRVYPSDIASCEVDHAIAKGGSFADGLDKCNHNNIEQLKMEV